MRRKLSLLLLLPFWLGASPPPSDTLPPQTEAAIARYRAELDRVQTARGRTSMEHLFALTDTLHDYLIYAGPIVSWNGRHEGLVNMESISEAEYERLSERLPGILLNREEVVIIEADSSVFLPLARAKGLEADRDFMRVYFRTYPDAWPVYIRQETDFSGCMEYGSGLLVELYGEWRGFLARHTGRYVGEAAEQMREFERAFLEPGGACGSRETVRREIRLFLSRFPEDPNASRAREALANLRGD
jgi:hypothetical protein